MEITLALLADAANISQEGKLNVLGAFTNINAEQFPARHPAMRLVLELDASTNEAGVKKKLEVKLMDADGKVLGGVTGEFVIPQPKQPGVRIRAGFVLPMNDVMFEGPGAHVFDIIIDGESRKNVSLTVTDTGGDDKNAT